MDILDRQTGNIVDFETAFTNILESNLNRKENVSFEDVKKDVIENIEEYFEMFEYELAYDRDTTIAWLESNQIVSFFEGFEEENIDFNKLSDVDLEYYFEEWIDKQKAIGCLI